MLNFTKGDLFSKSHEVDAIINTVNCVGVMGKGIALEFKNRYPDNYKIYKQSCDRGDLTPGKLLTVLNDTPGPKFIINFPTKKHWRHPSKLDYLKSGLVVLKEDIEKHAIKSVAMPALGCGNGGLDWAMVKELIIRELSSIEDVDFYIFEPGIVEKKAKATTIKLTVQRVLLLLLIEHYNSSVLKQKATTKEVHYLAYISQLLGVEFKLKFEEIGSGRSNSTLNKLLLLLVNNEYLVVDNNSENQNTLKVNKKKFNQKKSLLSNPEVSVTYNKVIELIKGFESHDRLYALTMAVWFHTKNPESEGYVNALAQWLNDDPQMVSEKVMREAANRVMSFHHSQVENLTFDI